MAEGLLLKTGWGGDRAAEGLLLKTTAERPGGAEVALLMTSKTTVLSRVASAPPNLMV